MNSKLQTHDVGQLKPNPFGLYDTHGNVWEWIQDWWHPTYYTQFQDKAAIDPRGPLTPRIKRVIREGGDWHNLASSCQSSHREAFHPSSRFNYVGFRVALSVDAIIALMAKPAG